MEQSLDREVDELNRLYKEYCDAVQQAQQYTDREQQLAHYREPLRAYNRKLKELPDVKFSNTNGIHYL